MIRIYLTQEDFDAIIKTLQDLASEYEDSRATRIITTLKKESLCLPLQSKPPDQTPNFKFWE